MVRLKITEKIVISEEAYTNMKDIVFLLVVHMFMIGVLLSMVLSMWFVILLLLTIPIILISELYERDSIPCPKCDGYGRLTKEGEIVYDKEVEEIDKQDKNRLF